MMPKIKLSPATQEFLCCPVCRGALRGSNSLFLCENDACRKEFPIVDGVPILLNEENSLFSFEDFTARRETTFTDLRDSDFKKAVKRLIPGIGKNMRAEQNYKKMSSLLVRHFDSPRVLVIGGGILGFGMEYLKNEVAIELVETDVSFGRLTKVVVDSHDIPFIDGSFQGVVMQAVLNCVVDPHRCVDEIHRVLCEGGYIYVEAPFMQPGCTGRYDFTRFTHLGLLRLLRRFEGIGSGVHGGPGMALAWSYKYFLLSFAETRALRRALWVFAHFTSFYLKYFDHYLINKAGAIDGASGVYFLGKKSKETLSDRDLVRMYKGAF
jgi:uncharacterized protein YbaR (Trm112 family)/ubiquinone/menaquinone biosynthesis C-methylase UbiE